MLCGSACGPLRSPRLSGLRDAFYKRMLYQEAPKDFSPRFQVAGCFCEHDGKILVLRRRRDKRHGGKWGLPGGKLEAGEEPAVAVIRELHEETGIARRASEVRFLKTVCVRHFAGGPYDFIYHMFHIALPELPGVVTAEAEHDAFQWAAPEDALRLDAVDDFEECVRMFLRRDFGSGDGRER